MWSSRSSKQKEHAKGRNPRIIGHELNLDYTLIECSQQSKEACRKCLRAIDAGVDCERRDLV